MTAAEFPTSGLFPLTAARASKSRIFINPKSTAFPGLPTASKSPSPVVPRNKTWSSSKQAPSLGLEGWRQVGKASPRDSLGYLGEKSLGYRKDGLDQNFQRASLWASAAKFPRLPSLTSIIHRG